MLLKTKGLLFAIFVLVSNLARADLSNGSYLARNPLYQNMKMRNEYLQTFKVRIKADSARSIDQYRDAGVNLYDGSKKIGSLYCSSFFPNTIEFEKEPLPMLGNDNQTPKITIDSKDNCSTIKQMVLDSTACGTDSSVEFLVTLEVLRSESTNAIVLTRAHLNSVIPHLCPQAPPYKVLN
jgi:hypothetical protein